MTQPQPTTTSVSSQTTQVSSAQLQERDTTAGFPTMGHLRKFVAAATALPDTTVVTISNDGLGIIEAQTTTPAA